MFHHVREHQLAELAAKGQKPDDLPRHKRVQVPEINKLTVNYRTHNGILGAASEVVSLLLKLFPHSVDALEKDRGHFDGPKPVLLKDTTTDDLAMMLMGSDPAHSQIEFGAHQVLCLARGRVGVGLGLGLAALLLPLRLTPPLVPGRARAQPASEGAAAVRVLVGAQAHHLRGQGARVRRRLRRRLLRGQSGRRAHVARRHQLLGRSAGAASLRCRLVRRRLARVRQAEPRRRAV